MVRATRDEEIRDGIKYNRARREIESPSRAGGQRRQERASEREREKEIEGERRVHVCGGRREGTPV